MGEVTPVGVSPHCAVAGTGQTCRGHGQLREWVPVAVALAHLPSTGL